MEGEAFSDPAIADYMNHGCTLWGGHPLFKSFIQSALKHQTEREQKVAA